MFIHLAGKTDKGMQRLDNQDAIFVAQAGVGGLTQTAIDQHGYLLAVADGVGGDAGGREASQAIITYLAQVYYSSPAPNPLENLRQAITQANQRAAVDVRMKFQDAATTLVTAVILNNQLFVANIGDSRAYLLRGGQLRQLTADHRQDGKLARYLVATSHIQPDFFLPVPLQAGDRVLLCSDGLYEAIVDAGEVARLAGKGGVKTAVNRLVKTANEYGGPDNISVVMAEAATKHAAALSAAALPGGLAAWQLGLLGVLGVAALTLLIFLGIQLFGGSGDEATPMPDVPTLAVTVTLPAVADTPAPPTPDNNNSADAPVTEPTPEPTDTTAPGQPTSTPAPTRTPSPTRTNTPIPPPPTATHTHTPTPTQTPVTPTNTPVTPAPGGGGDQPPPATQPPPPTPEPPADSDGDGVPDDQDACPNEPAGPNPDPARPGCPAPP
ncbi:MAG: protein phosphatase 2C domain-containing protein [Anaerolinea sp.]|nr:protein phosphatase 2C domain-containing protein [Anaerolinea sp.]